MHTRLTRGVEWGMHPDIQMSYVHNRNAYYMETVVFVHMLKMLCIWYIEMAATIHMNFSYNRIVLHATCNEIYQRVHSHPSPCHGVPQLGALVSRDLGRAKIGLRYVLFKLRL